MKWILISVIRWNKPYLRWGEVLLLIRNRSFFLLLWLVLLLSKDLIICIIQFLVNIICPGHRKAEIGSDFWMNDSQYSLPSGMDLSSWTQLQHFNTKIDVSVDTLIKMAHLQVTISLPLLVRSVTYFSWSFHHRAWNGGPSTGQVVGIFTCRSPSLTSIRPGICSTRSWEILSFIIKRGSVGISSERPEA